MTDASAKDQAAVSALIEQACRVSWESGSKDKAIEILRPALEKRNSQAYQAAINILISGERLDEAAEYAKMLVSQAESDLDFSTIVTACESHVFSMLSLDEEAIQKHALFTLANRGNPLIQCEIALYYLHGTAGFEKDDASFRKWIEKAIDSSDEIDPVCYLVEHLIHTGSPINPRLLERLRAEVRAQPDWKEIQELLRSAELQQS